MFTLQIFSHRNFTSNIRTSREWNRFIAPGSIVFVIVVQRGLLLAYLSFGDGKWQMLFLWWKITRENVDNTVKTKAVLSWLECGNPLIIKCHLLFNQAEISLASKLVMKHQFQSEITFAFAFASMWIQLKSLSHQSVAQIFWAYWRPWLKFTPSHTLLRDVNPFLFAISHRHQMLMKMI